MLPQKAIKVNESIYLYLFAKKISGGGEGAKNFLLPHTPKEFFAPERRVCVSAPPRFCGAGQLFFSRIFDKMSSSRVVYMLQYQTFFVFLEIFVGGQNGRPLRFEGGIRSARRALARLAV